MPGIQIGAEKPKLRGPSSCAPHSQDEGAEEPDNSVYHVGALSRLLTGLGCYERSAPNPDWNAQRCWGGQRRSVHLQR